MIKVLAIDVSHQGNMGLALIERDTVFSTLVTIHAKSTPRERLVFYAETVEQWIQIHQPDVLVYEKVRQFHNDHISLPAITRLSEMIGAIKYVAGKYTIEMWQVNTSSWKASVLHNGRAHKDASVAYVQHVFNKKVTHDEADAICIGIYTARFIQVVRDPIENVMERVV